MEPRPRLTAHVVLTRTQAGADRVLSRRVRFLWIYYNEPIVAVTRGDCLVLLTFCANLESLRGLIHEPEVDTLAALKLPVDSVGALGVRVPPLDFVTFEPGHR